MQEMINRLHAQGGRMTSQRRLILETLMALGNHPTAEELYAAAKLKAPNLHLSTVYRTLRWLEQEGLVNTLWFQEDRRQERFDQTVPSEHHHFQCTSCRQVIEFASPIIAELKAQFTRMHGIQVQMASVQLYGLCPDCLRVEKFPTAN